MQHNANMNRYGRDLLVSSTVVAWGVAWWRDYYRVARVFFQANDCIAHFWSKSEGETIERVPCAPPLFLTRYESNADDDMFVSLVCLFLAALLIVFPTGKCSPQFVLALAIGSCVSSTMPSYAMLASLFFVNVQIVSHVAFGVAWFFTDKFEELKNTTTALLCFGSVVASLFMKCNVAALIEVACGALGIFSMLYLP